jgi:hypothetical protein
VSSASVFFILLPPHAVPTTRLTQPTSVSVGIIGARFGIARLPRNCWRAGSVRRFSSSASSLRKRLSPRLRGSRPPGGGACPRSVPGPGPEEPGTPPRSGLGGGCQSGRGRRGDGRQPGGSWRNTQSLSWLTTIRTMNQPWTDAKSRCRRAAKKWCRTRPNSSSDNNWERLRVERMLLWLEQAAAKLYGLVLTATTERDVLQSVVT